MLITNSTQSFENLGLFLNSLRDSALKIPTRIEKKNNSNTTTRTYCKNCYSYAESLHLKPQVHPTKQILGNYTKYTKSPHRFYLAPVCLPLFQNSYFFFFLRTYFQLHIHTIKYFTCKSQTIFYSLTTYNQKIHYSSNDFQKKWHQTGARDD